MKAFIKYFPIVAYLLWAVIGTICAFCGNVAAGLSWLWIPLVILFFVWLVISLSWIAGDRIKAKSPKKCENCVFYKQKQIQGLCLGEQLGETYGAPCRCYARYNYDRPGTELE